MRYKITMGIIGIVLILVVVGVAVAQLSPETGIIYDEAGIKDVPDIIRVVNDHLNDGGICGIPNEITEEDVTTDLSEYNRVFGEGVRTQIRRNNGEFESLVIAFRLDNVMYFKAVVWDMDLPQENWTRIIHESVLELLSNEEGVTELRASVRDNTYIANYVREIMGSELIDEEENLYSITLEDFNAREVDYSAKLDYQPIEYNIRAPRNPDLTNAEQLNEYTYVIR